MNKKSQHPEFEIEKVRLEKVFKSIWADLMGVNSSPPIYGHKFELRLRRNSLTARQKTLEDALYSRPYFGRFDYKDDANQEIEEFYITKFEKLSLQHGPVSIIYWASPIATLYYQKQRARVSYDSKDDENTSVYHGDVYLRRQLIIEQCYLDQVIDEFDRREMTHYETDTDLQFDLVDPDEYLRLVLEGKRGQGLSEIVTSIQEQQNDIMRSDPDQILIVQGSAGSGKTTIALHRVAILLYQSEGTSKFERKRLMVIGANEFFLKFVANVLPSLNIENVPQRTFVNWASSITGIDAMKSFKDQTLEDVYNLSADITFKNKAFDRSKLKGSLQFADWLYKVSEQYRIKAKSGGLAIYPVGDGSLGVFYTIAENEMSEIIEQSKDMPVNLQRDLVVTQLTQKFIEQHDIFHNAWVQQIEAILDNPPPELNKAILKSWDKKLQIYRPNVAPERRERINRHLRDEIAKLVDKEFKRHLPLEIYKEFLTNQRQILEVLDLPNLGNIENILLESEAILFNRTSINNYALEPSEIVEATKQIIDQIKQILDFKQPSKKSPKRDHNKQVNFEDIQDLHKMLTDIYRKLQSYELVIHEEVDSFRLEDVAPIMFLHLLFNDRRNEYSYFDHIIVDEAQDMSPLQLWLLRRFTSKGAMTILGDLAQSIHAYRGITSWSEFDTVFVDDHIENRQIERTYRSTTEIMSFANQILQNNVLRLFNYQIAEPFDRRGFPVRIYGTSNSKELLTAIEAEINIIQSREFNSIAIIARNVTESQQIHSYLHNKDYPVELVISDESSFVNKLIVIPAFLAKGIEFDACIIANASSKMYPSDDLHGRLLYVAVTRALHELVVLWHGNPSVHLPNEAS